MGTKLVFLPMQIEISAVSVCLISQHYEVQLALRKKKKKKSNLHYFSWTILPLSDLLRKSRANSKTPKNRPSRLPSSCFLTCILVVFHGLSFLEIPTPFLFSFSSFSIYIFLSYLSLISLSLLLRLSLSVFPLMASQNPQSNFEDYLPVMAGKLGGDGLIDELCNGFNLLMDSDKGVITFESLKRNSAFLGLQDLADEDLRSMITEGDFDGDGALNQLEFCVLMFRLSPELMEGSKLWLQQVLQQELNDYV